MVGLRQIRNVMVGTFGTAIVGAAAVGAVSAAYQKLADLRDWRRYPPPGRLVDIGGRRLHIFDAGEGRPVVVIVPALATPAEEWAPVQQALADTTRVVLVDRAGLGWSDVGPWPRTAGTMADELHALLVAARIPPPYILVGHSAGGPIIRMFTARHPDQVAGMALLDTSHEDQIRRLGDLSGGYFKRAVRTQLQPLGLARMAIDRGKPDPEAWKMEALPPDLGQAGLAMRRSSRQRHASVQETFGLPRGFAEVAAEASGAGSLGDLPLLVLTSTPDWDWRGGPAVGEAAERRRRFWPPWLEMQKEQAALSSDSRHVIAEKAGHHLHRDDPAFVVEQLRAHIDHVRARRAQGRAG